MIAKGTTHNNGARLASYMTTGKNGERAELWQLRGFEAADITDAFRDVQIIAGATKAEQPFFHVQVRNRKGEVLTRQQWEHTADRIEQMLGLADQPRAIAFHINNENGHEHMHVAWSRIDENEFKAIPLPFFKERLKKVSRELELHFALEPVTSKREGVIQYAPTRAESEQARRLGIDIDQVRNTIRSCWDRSDRGSSFVTALEHEGLTFAKGDERDFVVLDHAGGLHVLGKRILGVTAAKTRDRLSDLARDAFPSVEAVRATLHERALEASQAEPLSQAPWDRDLDEQRWQDAVMDAAIDQEKVEEKFLGPDQRGAKSKNGQAKEDSRKKEPWQDKKRAVVAPELGKVAGEIRLAYTLTDSGRGFAQALEDRGFILGRMTEADAERLNRWEGQRLRELQNLSPEKTSIGAWMSERGGVATLTPELKESAERSYDAWNGNKNRFGLSDYVSYVQDKDEERKKSAPGAEQAAGKPNDKYRPDELVVVDQFGRIHQLNWRNTGQNRDAVAAHMREVERSPLLTVSSAENVAKKFQQHRREERQEVRNEAWRQLLNDARSPILPPVHQSWPAFDKAGSGVTDDLRPDKLKGPAAGLWDAWCQKDSDQAIAASLGKTVVSFPVPTREAFAAALDERGLSFAAVSKDEAERSYREAAFAREIGRYAPRFKDGEIVLVTEPRTERQRNGQIEKPNRLVKLDQSLAEKFVNHLGTRSQLQNTEATLKTSSARAEQRAIEHAAKQIEKATDIKDFSRKIGKAKGPATAAVKTAKGVGSVLNVLTDGIASLFSPTLTPKQLRDAEKSRQRREAEGDALVDLTKFTGEAAQKRQQQENELEGERQRDIDRGGRER